ncbi:hypothetical protein STEG23_024583 [Scotinomys teguina]
MPSSSDLAMKTWRIPELSKKPVPKSLMDSSSSSNSSSSSSNSSSSSSNSSSSSSSSSSLVDTLISREKMKAEADIMAMLQTFHWGFEFNSQHVGPIFSYSHFRYTSCLSGKPFGYRPDAISLESLPEAKVRSSGLIPLAEEISEQPSMDCARNKKSSSGLWKSIAHFQPRIFHIVQEENTDFAYGLYITSRFDMALDNQQANRRIDNIVLRC